MAPKAERLLNDEFLAVRTPETGLRGEVEQAAEEEEDDGHSGRYSPTTRQSKRHQGRTPLGTVTLSVDYERTSVLYPPKR